LETLMAEHGVWPTLRAALGLALRRPEKLVLPHDLSPHLRRDLALQEPEAGRKYWELR
jgi:hypothetical protein